MRARAMAAWLAAAACTSESRLSFELEDALAIAVVVPPGDAPIEDGFAAKRPGPGTLKLNARPGDRVVLFELPRSAFVGADGGAADIATVEVVSSAASVSGAGSCGRCLVRAATPPQLVYPGDRCQLPLFVEKRVFLDGHQRMELEGDDNDAIDRALAAVHLAWPGECPCTPSLPDPRAGRPLRHRVLNRAANGDAWPLGIVAQLPNGDVASVQMEHAVLLGVDGTRRERTRFDGTVCPAGGREDPALPFTGPVHAAVGLSAGRIFVAAADGRSAAREALGMHFFTLDRTLAGAEVRITDVAVRASTMRAVSGGEHVLVAAGELPSVLAQRPALLSCRPEDGVLCARLLPPDAFSASDKLNDAAILEDGSAVAVTSGGGVALVGAAPPPEMVRQDRTEVASGPDRHGELVLEGGRRVGWKASEDQQRPFAFDLTAGNVDFRTVAAFGQRVFTCAHRNEVEAGLVVLTASVSRADVEGARRQVSLRDAFQITFCTPKKQYAACGTFTREPGMPGVVRANLAGGYYALLDAKTGAAIDPPPCTGNCSPASRCMTPKRPSALPGSPLVLVEQFELVPGWTLAIDHTGGLHRRRDEGPAPAYTRIYGRPELLRDGAAGVVAIDERTFWAIGDSGRRQVVTVRSPAVSDVVEDQLRGIAPGRELITGVARDPRGMTILVGDSTSAVPRPWVRRLSGEPPVAVPVELPASLGTSPVKLLGVTSVGQERFAILADAGRAFWLEGGAIQEVPLRETFDDPFVPGEEPDLVIGERGCDARRGLDNLIDAPRFRAIDGALGVAWAAGCGGALARITARDLVRTWVDEGISAEGSFGPNTRIPHFSAVRALCPDEVVVASSGRNDADRDRGRTWRVAPAAFPDVCPGVAPKYGRLVCPLPENEGSSGSSPGIASGTPSRLFGARGTLGMTFISAGIPQGTLVRFQAPPSFRMATQLLEAEESPQGHVLALGPAGRLVLGYDCAAK